MPNSTLFFGSLLTSQVWGCPSASGRPWIKKLQSTKSSFNFIFFGGGGEGLFYAKNTTLSKIPNFEAPQAVGWTQIKTLHKN
jgi:hypothetical protein